MRTFAGIFVSAACLLWTSAPVASQEIGVYRLGTSSAMPQLDAPAGAGAVVRMFPSGISLVRLGLQHAQERTARVGRVCNTYSPAPSINCQDEAIENRTDVTSLYATAGLRHGPVRFLEFDLGVGGSLNQLNVDEDTESGRRSGLVLKRGAQWGLMMGGGARLRPIPRVPVTVEATAGVHRLQLTYCSDDGFVREDLYCGGVNLRELRIGIGYTFGM